MLVILEGLSVPFQSNYESPLSYQSFKSDVLEGLQIDLSGFSVYLSGRLLLSGDSITLPDTESNITILQVRARVLGGERWIWVAVKSDWRPDTEDHQPGSVPGPERETSSRC